MNRIKRLDLISNLIKKRKELHINDPEISNYWVKCTKLLTENLEDSKWVINNLNGDDIVCISEIFDDLSGFYQSECFIGFLIALSIKHPNIDLTTDIAFAKKSIVKFN